MKDSNSFSAFVRLYLEHGSRVIQLSSCYENKVRLRSLEQLPLGQEVYLVVEVDGDVQRSRLRIPSRVNPDELELELERISQ